VFRVREAAAERLAGSGTPHSALFTGFLISLQLHAACAATGHSPAFPAAACDVAVRRPSVPPPRRPRAALCRICWRHAPVLARSCPCGSWSWSHPTAPPPSTPPRLWMARKPANVIESTPGRPGAVRKYPAMRVPARTEWPRSSPALLDAARFGQAPAELLSRGSAMCCDVLRRAAMCCDVLRVGLCREQLKPGKHRELERCTEQRAINHWGCETRGAGSGDSHRRLTTPRSPVQKQQIWTAQMLTAPPR
jgi:hypothetical protein